MSEPLEIRRVPAPQARRLFAGVWTAMFLGFVLAVPSLYAAVVRDLETGKQIQAVGLSAIGIITVGWGASRLKSSRPLLNQDVVLLLTDERVRLRNGSVADGTSWTEIAWPDVVAVESRRAVLDPPHVSSSMEVTLVRFVTVTDDAIRVEHPTAYDSMKAAALGLSPAAACATMIIGNHAAERQQLVQRWVTAHRPDIPVIAVEA